MCVCVHVCACLPTHYLVLCIKYPQTQLLKAIKIYDLEQFPWVRNPRMGGSDPGSLKRLQSRCWPGLQSSEGLSGLGVHSQSSTLHAWQTGAGCGREAQSLTKWAFPKSCSKVLGSWQLASSRVRDPREEGINHQIFYDLALDVPLSHSQAILLGGEAFTHGHCEKKGNLI